MRGQSVLLLLAVAFAACVNASPYSKVPYTYQGQGFGNAKASAHSSASSQSGYGASSSSSASSSASASSSSYATSSANAQANIDASQEDGYFLKNPGTGSLDLEGDAEVPHQELQTPHAFAPASQGGSDSGAGQTQEGGNYWWMGAGSPFGPSGKPSIGCGSSACSASGTFDLNQGSGGAHAQSDEGQVQIQVNKNPFLNGGSFSAGSNYHTGYQQSGSSAAGSHQSGSSVGSSAGGSQTSDFSKNPFFNGASSGAGASASSSASASAHANAQASAAANAAAKAAANAAANAVANAAANAHANAVANAVANAAADATANAKANANAIANANANANANAHNRNPFLNPGVVQTPHAPGVQHNIDQAQYPDDSQSQEQSFDGYPEQNPTPKFPESSGFTVSCNGRGKICVAKHLCNNGYVSPSLQGLTQVRSGAQDCDVNREVCCTISSQKSPDQSPAGSGYYDGPIESHPHTGGIFDDDGQQPLENNGYLPPSPSIGHDGTAQEPSFLRPPVRPKEVVPAPSEPAPTHVQLGCAAALVCVEEQMCGMDGTMSPTPVSLTSEQLLRRVPLSDCKNPDNGVIGKCCRDPNYVDPWPAGNLPANYSGGFDEQGFPTFLNIQRNRPTKKPSPPPAKGRPPVKGFPIDHTSQQKQFPSFPEIQNQISGALNNYFKPTQTPPVQPSDDESVGAPVKPNRPAFPSFPSFPNLPNPFGQKNYESSATDEHRVAITPHTPGSQCGVKNTVQRPSGLSDVEVGFGEIPWQAMILDNDRKKLLCSGAFVAPNAVLTAARCLDGFEPAQISVKAGEWKLGYELKHEEPLPFQIVQVESIVPHPGYLPGYAAHDVAMLMLEKPVALDRHVDTICLGKPEVPKPGSRCISTGWGKSILETHAAGALMRAIDVDVMSIQDCEQRLQEAEGPVDLDQTLVCAKAHRRNNNMCQVDFGGPLACDRGDGHYEIMGVYTQDTGCIPTNQVATFALVDDAWVQQTLKAPPVPEAQRRVEDEKPQTFERQQPCDCQKSNLPSQNNQYLPPV